MKCSFFYGTNEPVLFSRVGSSLKDMKNLLKVLILKVKMWLSVKCVEKSIIEFHWTWRTLKRVLKCHKLPPESAADYVENAIKICNSTWMLNRSKSNRISFQTIRVKYLFSFQLFNFHYNELNILAGVRTDNLSHIFWKMSILFIQQCGFLRYFSHGSLPTLLFRKQFSLQTDSKNIVHKNFISKDNRINIDFNLRARWQIQGNAELLILLLFFSVW